MQDEERADGSAKVAAGSLFTSEGLQASYRDLEQIFDNSDTSSDETVSAGLTGSLVGVSEQGGPTVRI